MSASLVGSEMCIRDRCALTERQGAVAPHVVAESEESVVVHCTAIYVTVSYTHLTLPTICSV
eukprot:12489646-Alexandrium_andersonii.AAC.1